MKNQPNKISPILLKFISYSIADIARFKGLIPQQLSDNLLVKLLFGVVESLHTLRAANGCFGFDVAEAVLAIKSHKSQACQVHKLGSAMLTSNSVSCSHNYIILRFLMIFEYVVTTSENVVEYIRYQAYKNQNCHHSSIRFLLLVVVLRCKSTGLF